MAEGFSPEDYESDPVEVWPENWPAVRLLIRLQTQWRVGAGGRTGLDYQVAFRLMDNMGLTPLQWDQLFDDLREVEAGALEAMNSSN